MFWSLLSLVVLLLLIRFGFWVVKSFMVWLGRGEPVKRAVRKRTVSPEVIEAVNNLAKYRAAKHLGQQTKKPVHLAWKQIVGIQRSERLVRDDYVDHMHMSWYQCVIIFLLCAFGGLVLEEVWMFISAGLTQGRYGLVWGPFSPVYGIGALFLTAAGTFVRRKNIKPWVLFISCMLIGGALEQLTGWLMETYMGAVSWDYIAGHVPGAITKWVAVPYLFVWGILGCLWTYIIMPWFLFTIGEPTTKRQVVFVALLMIYVIADFAMTLVCFNRRTARDEGIPPQNSLEEWVDGHYSNEFMSQRFENMVIEQRDPDE